MVSSKHYYRLRTMLIVGAVVSAAAAASAQFLDSFWFVLLTGWSGGGGYVVEVFARDVSARLAVLPAIFACADLYVVTSMRADRRLRGFWIFGLVAYVTVAVLCNSALSFAQSARE